LFDQHRVVDTSLASLRSVLLAREAAGDPDAVALSEALGGFTSVCSECRDVDIDDAGLAPTAASDAARRSASRRRRRRAGLS
jgi:hypothetical protein